MSDPAKKSATIRTVEMARGLAALFVVLFHANSSADEFGGPDFGWLTFGEHGVDFFFVLSGFIIALAHGRDIGMPSTGKPYVLKRAIRLLPPLWIIVIGWTCLRAVMGAPVDPGAVARSTLLYPSLAPTIPIVVWTLRHEMLFYLVFLVLIVRPGIGRALFAIWGIGAVAQLVLAAFGRPVLGIASFFLSTYTLDFMMGMGLGFLHRRHHFTARAWPLLAGIALTAALLVAGQVLAIKREGLSDYISLAATWWTLALGVGFAVTLHGLVRIEQRVKVPNVCVFLGAASYTIYLMHTIANSFTQRIVARLPDALKEAGIGHVVMVLAGIIVAVIFYRIVERPVTGYLRRMLVPRAAAPATGAA